MLDPDRLSKDVSILAHWQATRLPEPQFPLLENGSSSELNTSCPSGVWHTAQDAPTFLPYSPPPMYFFLSWRSFRASCGKKPSGAEKPISKSLVPQCRAAGWILIKSRVTFGKSC